MPALGKSYKGEKAAQIRETTAKQCKAAHILLSPFSGEAYHCAV